MLAWEDVAWWPFDGLAIGGEAYANKHVAVEIYPSALRPRHVPQNDDNDAMHSCLYTQYADQHNTLGDLMDLAGVPPRCQQRILAEGWIVGMNAHALP
jgi:hypothetical protein